jgi:hypothetical protein
VRVPAGWLALAALAALAGGPPRAAHAEGVAARAIEDLDAPAWVVRRTAERVLDAEGEAAIVAAAGDGSGRARAVDFSTAIETGLSSGRPAVAAAIRRLLLRLERSGEATDDRVRHVPRLLALRVDRLAPQVVEAVEPEESIFERFGRPSHVASRGDAVAAGSLRGLLPEALPILVEVVRTTTDAKRLAGALAILGGDTGAGLAEPAAIAAVVERVRRDPDFAAEVRAYEAFDRTYPIAHVALALALSGEAGRVPALLRHAPQAAQGSAVDLVRRRLPAAGMGDVAQHDRFLDRAFRGTVTARDAAEAARRALDAGLPWIARLEARRGRFLDASEPACRAALVASAVALGLGATARLEAEGKIDLPPSVPTVDDEKAKAADALLRDGAFGKRLVWRIEAGNHLSSDLVPIAIARGLLAFGNTIGDIAVVPVASAERRHRSYSTARGIPRAVALSGPYVAAISSRGDLVTWRVSERDMAYERMTAEEGKAGGYAVVTASSIEGKFLLASKDGRLHLVSGGDEPQPLAAPAAPEKGPPVSLALLGFDTALVGRAKSAERVHLQSGAVTSVVDGDRPVVVAPYGTDVLVARGKEWEVRGQGGAVRTLPATSDAIVGIAGDRAAGIAYLAFADAVAAFDVASGALLWSEPVEASGSPVLGGGLLVVPAGRGRADGRRDRTLTALRPGLSGFDPFDEASRTKIVALATSAAKEGRLPVAELLLDPVLDSLPTSQREEAERALGLDRRPVPPPGAEDEEDDGR